MNSLVGYTGFVGSNLNTQYRFDAVYNSKNIQDAFGLHPELCVYAGVRADKYLADKQPEADRAAIKTAIDNIQKIDAKRLVLISTIDVFGNTNGADENTSPHSDATHAYGFNRRYLEKWVTDHVEDYCIIRLPGLFGKNIRKNFIYDLIHIRPSMLSKTKYEELSAQSRLISECYQKQDNGFYKCVCQTDSERQSLKQVFELLGFTALNFTDSRAVFQFYNLAYLWEHIQFALSENIRLLHLAVEPTAVTEVYHAVKGCEFLNKCAAAVPHYDFRTVYAEKLGGKNGYIFDKQQILQDIRHFVNNESHT